MFKKMLKAAKKNEALRLDCKKKEKTLAVMTIKMKNCFLQWIFQAEPANTMRNRVAAPYLHKESRGFLLKRLTPNRSLFVSHVMTPWQHKGKTKSEPSHKLGQFYDAHEKVSIMTEKKWMAFLKTHSVELSHDDRLMHLIFYQTSSHDAVSALMPGKCV